MFGLALSYVTCIWKELGVMCKHLLHVEPVMEDVM